MHYKYIIKYFYDATKDETILYAKVSLFLISINNSFIICVKG